MRNRDSYIESELSHIRNLLSGEPKKVKQRLNGYRTGLLGCGSPKRLQRIKAVEDLIKTL